MSDDRLRDYGYSMRDRAFWVRTPSGLKNYHRGIEALRYALRNEYGVPAGEADRIVNECLVDKHERHGGEQ